MTYLGVDFAVNGYSPQRPRSDTY